MAARIFGWKFVLLCCLGIVCAVLFLDLFVPDDPDTPTLPEELLRQTQGMRLSAGAWQRQIEAGRNDDSKLAEIVAESLSGSAYEAASVAASLVRSTELRDKLLGDIFRHSIKECASLPFATMSMQEMSVRPADSEKLIQEKWQECRKDN